MEFPPGCSPEPRMNYDIEFPPGCSPEMMLEVRVLAWLMKGAMHPCLPELIALDPLRA